MRTLGIDLASDPANTGVCRLWWSAGKARVERLFVGADDATLLALAADVDLIGIDAPFGWPTAFLAELAGPDVPADPPPDWGPARRDTLRWRVTDWYTRHTLGRWPLSVSTDLIGVPALRCRGLLARLKVHDRGGDGRVFETYPAGALQQWGFRSTGYKGAKGRGIRQHILSQLEGRAPWLVLSEADRAAVADRDDALDALVAAINARACGLGWTLAPEDDGDRAAAVREGWIHLPLPQALEDGLPDRPRLHLAVR